jgi:hypothetical protein
MKNMKKVFILLVLGAALMALAACGPRGGTIEVINEYRDPITNTPMPIMVNVNKLVPGTPDVTILPGDKEVYTFTEDGVYSVTALPPIAFVKPVNLLGGNTETVIVK